MYAFLVPANRRLSLALEVRLVKVMVLQSLTYTYTFLASLYNPKHRPRFYITSRPTPPLVRLRNSPFHIPLANQFVVSVPLRPSVQSICFCYIHHMRDRTGNVTFLILVALGGSQRPVVGKQVFSCEFESAACRGRRMETTRYPTYP